MQGNCLFSVWKYRVFSSSISPPNAIVTICSYNSDDDDVMMKYTTNRNSAIIIA